MMTPLQVVAASAGITAALIGLLLWLLPRSIVRTYFEEKRRHNIQLLELEPPVHNSEYIYSDGNKWYFPDGQGDRLGPFDTEDEGRQHARAFFAAQSNG